jgi:glycosyltransferase involved in cell wall biosynthesis
MGLPTITTSLGCEGLAVADGEHLLIRDRPEDFAAAIVTLLADAEQREALRRSGRNLVAAKYDWQRIFDQAVGLMIDRWQQWRDQANTSQAAP